MEQAIVVLRYLNDLSGDPRYVEYSLNGQVKLLKYTNFVKRYGSDFEDIPVGQIMTQKEKDESAWKQCTSETDIKGN